MTKIKPFQALIYNPDKIKDLSKVVCPPYDVISTSRQDYFHKLDPHNLIHVDFRKDNPKEDKYINSGDTFHKWISEQILIRDKKPGIYFYNQQYHLKGETKSRLGFISLMHLGENNKSAIGHENTRTEAKEDRFKLMSQTHANLSPIFIIFLDKKRIIQSVYQNVISNQKPLFEAKDDEKGVHKIWRIDDPQIIAQMQSKIANENSFIADGHHRFEVACAYRESMRKKLGGHITGEEDFNYVMAYFTNTDPRGLTILPIHRLVKPETPIDIDKFQSTAGEYFDIEEIKDKTKFFFLLQKAGKSEHVIGMYNQKKYWLFRLKNVKVLDKLILNKPAEYRTLDVSILNSIVFEKIMGMQFENKPTLSYSHNSEELISAVDNDPSFIAFFLNPVKIEEIIAVSLKQEKMPAKSTFFYPKVLSGLLINKFEE